ncbi:unnamed protein product [Darwinula stevensoni]|uniref:Cleavage and polyadenylation specificity factor subunit 4 n=1 Tax=Darwinula stevensoni TaxID=69355 RepID=A0A7R9ADG6_9CRUS|nr:unnamed protein product [Darwinula stevensoni]CAG0900774.1 unnamed protein product [Darwinula stevensoni]
MEDIIANVEEIRFGIEHALETQVGAQPLPFPGMDKSTSAVCTFYDRGMCNKGQACPFRHLTGDRTVVCKHWLRGLCKKGDQCEFLHEFDMTKMPECYFYSKFNACHNKDCPFLHIDPESKVKDCPWYDRGFCRHGPNCRHRHTRRVMCFNYLAGFCPDGPSCKYKHPRFELPLVPDDPAQARMKKLLYNCHYCGESGHKIYQCFKLPPEIREAQTRAYNELMNKYTNMTEQPKGPSRPLEEVTCFKCGGKGHYANKCPKGHLAFLSSDLQRMHELNKG